MFSKKTVLTLVIIIILAVNIIFLFFSSRHPNSFVGTERIAISAIAPFQEFASKSIRYIKGLWLYYFFLVSASKENESLKTALSHALEKNNRCRELEIANLRLRKLLDFKESIESRVLAAEVISKDTSPWFKSLIINKGEADGLCKALPVVSPEGVVGVITSTSARYAKVLLMIDQNSAVDALVQRTRGRGIVKGSPSGLCKFEYVLRRNDILVDDVVISSGLDGLFPKGLRVGRIIDVASQNSDIFQNIIIEPYVDFETIEDVLVILNPPPHDFTDTQ